MTEAEIEALEPFMNLSDDETKHLHAPAVAATEETETP